MTRYYNYRTNWKGNGGFIKRRSDTLGNGRRCRIFPFIFRFSVARGYTVYLLFFLHSSKTSCSGRLSIFYYWLCALGQWICSLKVVIADYSCLALFSIRLQRILLLIIPTVTFAHHLAMNEFPRYSYGTFAPLSRTWFHYYARVRIIEFF